MTEKSGSGTAKRTTRPRKTGKWVRNLHNSVVHLRLGSRKDPTEVNLEPRGLSGDMDFVPPELIEDGTFIAAVNTLVEIITETEYNKIQAAYAGRRYDVAPRPEIIHEDDATIATQDNWDGKQRAPKRRKPTTDKELARQPHKTGMNVVDVPGSDSGLHAELEAAQRAQFEAEAKIAELQAQIDNPALPPEAAKKPKVTVTRAKGKTNAHTIQ